MIRLISISIFIITFLFSIFSCSEEIKPSTDGKETAIVYGVLNASDTVHFIKINRAIYGGGDLTSSALYADSSYFKQVDATITEFENGQVKRTWKLKDTLITNKEPGAFYYPEQKVYYFKTAANAKLKSDANTYYQLDADINNGSFKISGKTNLTGGLTISQPSENGQFSFATDNIEKFGYSATAVNFNTGNAQHIEVLLDIEFEEYVGANLLNTKAFSWKLSEISQENINPTVSVSAAGQTFYELIKANVTNDNAITKRVFKGINVRILGANNDLQKYLLVSKPSSSLAQSKPTYTNLTATNDMRIIGILASRFDVNRYKPKFVNFNGTYLGCLNNPSMKELCTGTITGQLLFCSDSPADASKIYSCN
jgi:hypothetical protein